MPRRSGTKTYRTPSHPEVPGLLYHEAACSESFVAVLPSPCCEGGAVALHATAGMSVLVPPMNGLCPNCGTIAKMPVFKAP
eukprot:1425588-Pyramimonas_sp.AAC.1